MAFTFLARLTKSTSLLGIAAYELAMLVPPLAMINVANLWM